MYEQNTKYYKLTVRSMMFACRVGVVVVVGVHIIIALM